MVAVDRKSALCPRTESDVLWGAAGYVHDLDDEDVVMVAPQAVIPDHLSHYEIQVLVNKWCELPALDRLSELAAELGVSLDSLTKLNVGWTGQAYSFPMRNGLCEYTGVRFRGRDGRKWSLRGGREGLFMPATQAVGEYLFIAEGATDTAALLSLGLSAVGRPNCRGGYEDIKHLLGMVAWPKLVIVADNDNPGVQGARQLASRLTLEGGRVIVVRPGDFKDARENVANGAYAASLMEAAGGKSNDWWVKLG